MRIRLIETPTQLQDEGELPYMLVDESSPSYSFFKDAETARATAKGKIESGEFAVFEDRI